MKINKNSWHYKLVDHFDHDVVPKLIYNENVTLCQYFWSVVGALIKVLMLVFGSIVTVGLAAATLWVGFCAIMFLLIPITGTVMYPFVYDTGILTLFFVGSVWLFIGVVLTMCGEMKVVPKWMKSNTTEQEDKQPSLLWGWIKAKKDKVCPLVSLEGKE